MSLLDKTDEQALWRAVILRAVEDAVSTSTSKAEKAARDQARRWFIDDGKDFRRVCDLADMDPITVRKKALEVMAATIDDNTQPFSYRKPGQRKPKGSKIAFEGKAMTMKEWAQHLGMKYSALAMRLSSGWSIERALTTPCGARRGPGVVKNLDQCPRDRRGRHAQDCAKIENFS